MGDQFVLRQQRFARRRQIRARPFRRRLRLRQRFARDRAALRQIAAAVVIAFGAADIALPRRDHGGGLGALGVILPHMLQGAAVIGIGLHHRQAEIVGIDHRQHVALVHILGVIDHHMQDGAGDLRVDLRHRGADIGIVGADGVAGDQRVIAGIGAAADQHGGGQAQQQTLAQGIGGGGFGFFGGDEFGGDGGAGHGNLPQRKEMIPFL